MRNREGPKKLKALKSNGFIHIPMNFTFELTVTDDQMDQLVHRIVYDYDIGEWAIVYSATYKGRHRKITLPWMRDNWPQNIKYTFPIVVIDIDSDKRYTIRKENIYWALAITLIDFPYALDTTAGYTIDINKLTPADIDEIIQVAATGKVFYISDE